MYGVNDIVKGDNMNKILYSTLSYNDIFSSKKFFELGTLFSSEDGQFRFFAPVKNWNEICSFDEDLNMVFVQEFLNSITEGIKSHGFNINDYIKYYSNEFRFSEVAVFNSLI